MKSWMMLAMGLLMASSVLAQGRQTRGGAKGAEEETLLVAIKEISTLAGDGDYAVEAPTADEKFKKKIQHSDSYKKESGKGWHYFEVAYKVATQDPISKKPILALPEVEITYALLYDMKKSKLATAVAGRAKKTNGAIGWEVPKQVYSLLVEKLTYTTITPGRMHYAAVCVPPSMAVVYGDPIAFSVQISVDGRQQGEIVTQLAPGASVDGKKLEDLVCEKGPDGKRKFTAWWERIQNLTDSVVERKGILRDRSQTPFVMAGDMYYDQIKIK